MDLFLVFFWSIVLSALNEQLPSLEYFLQIPQVCVSRVEGRL